MSELGFLVLDPLAETLSFSFGTLAAAAVAPFSFADDADADGGCNALCITRCVRNLAAVVLLMSSVSARMSGSSLNFAASSANDTGGCNELLIICSIGKAIRFLN